eukprot:TRINITY_DN1737_c0_g3_i2.p1 TRINITY_DN1737_c0_g3~~TRINITY_DN1737_c0_g3_i2.p1  ORF type:complete len:171 (+),score=40.10 TRINITY_DN1737_c0_g3_i2:133-645(+)
MDLLIILGVSVLSALLAEMLSWVLVYRTESYKNMQQTVTRMNKKLERMRDPLSVKNKSQNRRAERYEESVKNIKKDMNMASFKSKAAMSVAMISLFALLNSVYSGLVVCRLPFEPIWMFKMISHRGLPGTDLYDCSMAFFYALCSLSIKPNVQKLIGHAPPRELPEVAPA